MKYLEWHRGPTHGPLGLIGLSVITASIVWWGRRWYDGRHSNSAQDTPTTGNRPPDASFAMLVVISMIGIALHVLMDLPTVYGTRPLSPFRLAAGMRVDWMPIVDIYLLSALGIGLLGRPTPAQARAKATFVLLLMMTNYGVRAASHRQALIVAPQLFGPTLPQPCDGPPRESQLLESWPQPVPSTRADGRRCLIEIAAMPSFTSPFRWRIIARSSNAYEIHDIDLLDQRFRDPDDESESDVPWRLTLRYPNVWTPTVQTAASTQRRPGVPRVLALPCRPVGNRQGPGDDGALDRRAVCRRAGRARSAGGRSSMFTATVRVAPDGNILEQFLGNR